MTKRAVVVIAAIAHAVNRDWCAFNGDTSQPTWEDAPDWQRESAVQGVEFHLAQPDAGDAASHENWMKLKLAEGWVFGDVKDPEKKTHPCLVPFDKLPPEQQFKDRLFRTIVHAAAPMVQMAADNEQLAGALDKAKARTRQAKAAEKGRKARALGPIDVDRAALDTAVQGPVELVFSDGAKEIVALEPLAVARDGAWEKRAGRWVLRERLLISGPAVRDRPYRIAGVAMLVDGKQVAWAAMLEPIVVAGGATVELRDSIIF